MSLTRVQQVRKSRRIKAKKDAEEETAEAKTEEPVENGKNSNIKKIGTEPRIGVNIMVSQF